MCSDKIIHDHNIKAIATIYCLINEYTKDIVSVCCTSPMILREAIFASCSRLCLIFLKFFFYVINILERLG